MMRNMSFDLSFGFPARHLLSPSRDFLMEDKKLIAPAKLFPFETSVIAMGEVSPPMKRRYLKETPRLPRLPLEHASQTKGFTK